MPKQRDFKQVPNPWFKRGNEIIEEGNEAFQDVVKFDDNFKSGDYSKEDPDLSYDLGSKTQRDFKANPNPWIVHNNEENDEIEEDLSQENSEGHEELIQE